MMSMRAPGPEWPWRLVLIVLGVGLILLGREMIRQGYLWVAGYNPRLGRTGYGPSLDHVAFGLVMILIGVIPWKPIFRMLDRRFLPKLKKPRTHVKWP
jgi:hypothetical protein